jgi:hypothetical protein
LQPAWVLSIDMDTAKARTKNRFKSFTIAIWYLLVVWPLLDANTRIMLVLMWVFYWWYLVYIEALRGLLLSCRLYAAPILQIVLISCGLCILAIEYKIGGKDLCGDGYMDKCQF